MKLKIGKFSEKNNVSIDTIRHYIDMRLIIPDKVGAQYMFDEKCQEDLENILDLKSLGFSLNEIRNISFYEELAKLDSYEKYDGYKKIFYDKYNEVSSKIDRLKLVQEGLKKKIESFEVDDKKLINQVGIPLKALKLISCLKCKKELELADGNIKNNIITNGILKCTCGEEYLIKDGILITDIEDMKENNYKINYIIDDYIKETDEKYISNLKTNLTWIEKRFSNIDLDNKVILELGSGYGFLLRCISGNLKTDSIYIAIDNNINRHLFLKNVIKNSNISRNVVFICTDFESIPLKSESVDILLDCTGSTNYWFDREKFTLDFIDSLMKRESYLASAYILFKKFDINGFIKLEKRKYFSINYIKEQLNKSKFRILEEYESVSLTKPGLYEDYFTENEEVFSYLVFGKRWG